jgi:hypothetical protein
MRRTVRGLGDLEVDLAPVAALANPPDVPGPLQAVDQAGRRSPGQAQLLLRGPLEVDLRVARPGQALEPLEPGPVVATLMPALAAVGLAALLRSRPRGLRRLAVAGWAFALLSLWAPLTLDVATGTKAGLTVLHLLPAAVVLPTLTRRPRSRPQQTRQP